ncbi:MAG: cupin [Pseudoruegeria sp.]
MKKITPNEYTGAQAWDALDIEQIENATVRLHWTDAPYKWHVNDGPEVFVVLDGKVDMHVRKNGVESVLRLNVGDIFHAENGDEHVAHPDGPVRALVIETAGSI